MHRFAIIVAILSGGFLTSSVNAQKAADIVVAIKGAGVQSGRNKRGEIPKGTLLTVKDVRGDRILVAYANGHEELETSIPRGDTIPFEKAIDFFTDEIQSKPTAENYCIRGTIWRLKREYEIAVGDYGDGIRLDPHYQPNFIGRGEAWIAKKLYDKAIADYNEAIRLNPRRPRLLRPRLRSRMHVRRRSSHPRFQLRHSP